MVSQEKTKTISEISKFSLLAYTPNRKLGNLENFSFTSSFGSVWNSKHKDWKNVVREKTLTLWCGLTRKMPISKVSEFSVLLYTQNQKRGNLRKSSFASTFGNIWNSKSKNWKNDLNKKTLTLWCGLRRKVLISKVSKFLILPYAWNQKLGNLGKLSSTSDFYLFDYFKYRKG